MSRRVWLATFAIACAHPTAPAGPGSGATHGEHAAISDASVDGRDDAPLTLDEDLPRLAERAVAMWRAWVDAFAQAGDDCGAAAAKVRAVADAYADVIAANERLLHGDKLDQLRAALAPHDAELNASARTVMHSPLMAKCHDDPAFAAALERLRGGAT